MGASGQLAYTRARRAPASFLLKASRLGCGRAIAVATAPPISRNRRSRADHVRQIRPAEFTRRVNESLDGDRRAKPRQGGDYPEEIFLARAVAIAGRRQAGAVRMGMIAADQVEAAAPRRLQGREVILGMDFETVAPSGQIARRQYCRRFGVVPAPP